MSKVRVCFLGTPDFAVVALKQLLADEHYQVVGVVTQPDRPAGRKMQLTPSPVKQFALSQGLHVITPESVNKDFILQEIESWGAEIAVVVAFGQILSQKFMDLFPFGAVNIHGSILPRWRGAAPIQRAIEAGDVESGVTLQKIVKQLDAGDVIGLRKTVIEPDLTSSQLYERLADLGAELLHIELMDYIRGNLAPMPQDPAGVTIAKKIEKSEAVIDWTRSALEIHNKIRAFNTGPGTFTTLQSKKIKIHRSQVQDGKSGKSPGQIVEINDQAIIVQTGQGYLQIFELQPESRARMLVKDFIKGNDLKVGDILN